MRPWVLVRSGGRVSIFVICPKLKETTGGEFRVYRASIRLL